MLDATTNLVVPAANARGLEDLLGHSDVDMEYKDKAIRK